MARNELRVPPPLPLHNGAAAHPGREPAGAAIAPVSGPTAYSLQPTACHSVITTIFAPNAAMEPAVLASLMATDAEFRGHRRIAGVDASTDAIEDYLLGHDYTWRDDIWEVIRPPSGTPPRMGTLLRMAIEACETPFLWTIEQDVEVHPGARARISAILADHPEVAGLECMTVNGKGRRHYPNNLLDPRPVGEGPFHKNIAPFADDDRLQHLRPWTSLCCVCWRVEALRTIDWSQVPNYPATDQVISRLLLRAGWDLAIAPAITARHRFGEAPWCRRFLPAGWEVRVGKAG